MERKRIAVITGTRAEYGILRPAMRRIDAAKNMELLVIVTGMHLSPLCGMTKREIEDDGFTIDANVEMLFSGDTRASMGRSVGAGIMGMTTEIERLKPDIVMVLGDRIEAFAGAVAGLFCGAVIAHLHGGEVTQGGLDEYMRHAITKLSHIHFPATPKSRDRIINMGEDPSWVYLTGTPGLDEILTFTNFSDSELSKIIKHPIPKQYLLIVQHPISTHPQTAADEMVETLEAVKKTGIPAFLIYPNADAGSQKMIQVIRQYQKEKWLTTFINVPRDVYCNLLRRSAALVGNSSSGIIDSPAYGIPVVNIGERQEGRERGKNVIDCLPARADIFDCIQKALTDRSFISIARNAHNPYGDGTASTKIIEYLSILDTKSALAAKHLPW